ncbi:hypothetical protein C2U72_15645 [Prosthecomicrobium hirschii]|uniref:WD40 repeat domain-containing protein n=1 Tax=Prosthecodimorpha hirschii TaxID=665126 RepID=UPI00112BFC56|nr:WD40 repeat domain-containing protein [Prosthecomicrobium hirschii]TPQ50008.1 hypothetical protein C2U72_15645 [Prosthecomicrobium hirschii]
MPRLTPLALPAYVVAVTHLGGRVAFALGDGSVHLGHAADDVRAVQVHDGGILAAVAAPDGKSLITAGDDGRVMATDAEGATQLLFEKKGKWIDQLACGPQGAVAFASGRMAWVRLADGQVVEFPHEKAVGGVAFLPKGLRLATATVDKAILHWVTAKGAPAELGWKGAHTGITVSPDGRFLVTTMQEMALHGWRIEDGKHMRMTGYPAKVKSVSWSPKGRWLATAGANAAILWPFSAKDGPMGKPPLQLGPYPKLATQVACHPTEEVVAIGYQDGMVLAVRFGDQAEVAMRHPSGEPVSALAWSPDGMTLAIGTESGAAGLVDIGAA